MYLIELIVKLFSKKKKSVKDSFDPFAVDTVGDFPDSNDCEHVFLPIDSSGETLACSKCGLVVKKDELKDINIFKRN